MDLEQIFHQLLGLGTEWQVTKPGIDEFSRTAEIHVKEIKQHEWIGDELKGTRFIWHTGVIGSRTLSWEDL